MGFVAFYPQNARRDFATLTISVRVGLSARKPSAALEDEIPEFADLGVHHVILESRVRDLADMTQIYEKFAAEVRAKL